MPKNFEIQLQVSKPIEVLALKQMVNALGVQCDAVHSIDDWAYTNERAVNNFDEINAMVNDNKIIVTQGKFNGANCGCLISKSESHSYQYEFWVAADAQLCEDKITPDNAYLFENGLKLIQLLVTDSLTMGVMGFELFGFGMREGSGVVRWVVPADKHLEPSDCTEQVLDGLRIYTRNR